MVTGYALPDFRPVVVRVTSFSEAAASIRSWVKEAINFLYRGHPRPNFIGYDPRTVELRLGRFVVLGAGSTALVALLSASVLYLLPSAGAGVGGGALGWVEGAPSQMKPPVDNQRHLYVLDGWGGVHPVGASPVLATSASWPTKDIAFSLALFPDGTGGYVMDGWGRLHPLGVAPALESGVYWPAWIGAREIVMAPWSSAGRPAGYLLDADGGIHAFGGAPAVTASVTWPAQGIARGMVLIASSTPTAVRGYTLDGFGGVHPFGAAPAVLGNKVFADDVARGIVLVDRQGGMFVQGYTLDYSGGLHPFGGAPPLTPSATWAGRDMADSLVAWTAAR